MHLWNIVVTTYNSEDTINDTLSSLSELAYKERIHIVICDDSSTDNTLRCVEKWKEHEKNFRRITILSHSQNGGISFNHKSGLDACDGDYAIYMGGDDWIYDSDLIQKIENTIPDEGLAIGKIDIKSVFTYNEKLNKYPFHEIKSFFRKSAKEQYRILLTVGNILSGGPGTILSVPAYNAIGGFDTEIRSFEDWPLYLSYTQKNHAIEFIDVQGLAWRRHEKSLSWGWGTEMSESYLKDVHSTLSRFFYNPEVSLHLFDRLYVKSVINKKPYAKLLKLLLAKWYIYILPQKIMYSR